jgi:sugar phosphate isomerase/epimerase
MRRRSFLRRLSVAVAGGAFGMRSAPRSPNAEPARARRLARIGLELYAVRDAMRRDPERTLTAVRAMGYTDVELLWAHGNFGRTTEQVKAALDRDGLRAPSAHIAPESLLTAWDQSLDAGQKLGHDMLIVPSLPEETRTSLDAWRRWADNFNRAGGQARQAGLWLAFHNESDHMKRIEGRVPYDVFIERTDPSVVRLQLDVGNMLRGGGDPFAYLARHQWRYWSFHLKDVAADRSHDTELGTGTFDFRRFLGMVTEIDRKACYVEQEDTVDSLASARRNFSYLAALDF